MTPSLNIISLRSMLAAGQPEAIAAEPKDFKSVTVTKRALQTWKSVCHITTLVEAFAGVFVVCYLLALVALSGALLFYTFNR